MDPHPSPNLASLHHQDQPTAISSPQSAQLPKLFVKALSLALIVALLPFVICRCLPLLWPFGIVFLRKLWDILRFVVLTTAVSFGILNSQRRETERGNRKEDNVQSRAGSPFPTMFGDLVEGSQLEAKESSERERDGSLKQTIDDERSQLEAQESIESERDGSLKQAIDDERSQLEAKESIESERDSSLKQAIDDDGVQMKKHISSGGGSSGTHISSLTNRERVDMVLHREENTEVDQAGEAGHDQIPKSCLSSLSTSGKQTRHRRAASLDQDFQFQPLTIPDKVNLFIKPVAKELDWGVYKSDEQSKNKLKTPRRNISFSFEYEEDWLQAYPPPPPLPPFYYETDDSDAMLSEGMILPVSINKPISPQVNVSDEEVASSPNEVNRRADAFIARFHEQMRLQRVESMQERYRKRMERTK